MKDHPECFDTQEQFDAWNKAADNVYHYGGRSRPAFCTDCTPAYAERMRQAGRCQHLNVRFYKCGNAYMGIHNLQQAGRFESLGEEWELVNVTNAEVVSADA